MSSAAVGAGAAAAAARANAIKASGVLIRVESATFAELVGSVEQPLVVVARTGFPKRYRYLAPYRGLAFYAVSRDEIGLPPDAELIAANTIAVPA